VRARRLDPTGSRERGEFEIDQPRPQARKRQRLIELGFGIPPWLLLVPVDFEAGGSWLERLAASGFDASRPAVVASTGVSMYLTKDAIAATLRQIAVLVPGSTLAMTFILPLEFAEPEERPGSEAAEKGARASGTPFISFFTHQNPETRIQNPSLKDIPQSHTALKPVVPRVKQSIGEPFDFDKGRNRQRKIRVFKSHNRNRAHGKTILGKFSHLTLKGAVFVKIVVL